ncbi:hypothetical protein, partial [Paucibacter sp. XJ19-41]|uniref:hypothetical protein n=1 Tax=Paucibacter sp. XJ19-41 TaxID=2927824 RepID=UPI00234B3A6A
AEYPAHLSLSGLWTYTTRRDITIHPAPHTTIEGTIVGNDGSFAKSLSHAVLPPHFAWREVRRSRIDFDVKVAVFDRGLQVLTRAPKVRKPLATRNAELILHSYLPASKHQPAAGILLAVKSIATSASSRH